MCLERDFYETLAVFKVHLSQKLSPKLTKAACSAPQAIAQMTGDLALPVLSGTESIGQNGFAQMPNKAKSNLWGMEGAVV